MSESVPVRCPACRREHVYTAPSYPCVCGAAVAPPLDRGAAATAVTHRVWDQDWITVRCPDCGRHDEWPQPELGCACGTVLRIPVTDGRPGEDGPGASPDLAASTGPGPAPEANTDVRPGTGPSGETGAGSVRGSHAKGTHGRPGSPHAPRSPQRRRAFQPIAIRSARDAVTVAALYLRWLGYRNIRRADQRPPSGVGLAARGVVAQVDPTVSPASLRDVECLWLTAMVESTDCVYFSLAGYTDDARARADSLGIPLFVLDLTGTPQPANSLADDLNATGA